MDPTRFRRLQELFAAAAALPAAARPDFLRKQPRADHDLVLEVSDLLGYHKEEILAPSAAAPGQPVTTLTPGIDPAQVGRYRIVERLGEGGMGVVYRAEQAEPIRRQVALKIVKAGMDTRAVLARFERERQALAMMDHDGIAKVFDCGADEAGRPYFAMELVRGAPIDAYCDGHRVSLIERLQLIQRVCEAVQHAHQKGVVHRDLKPSNILVVEAGDTRQVKVIDFGLAKVIDEEPMRDSLATQNYRILGTPEYMAPEQADQRPSGVDTRVDVYSLGVILYELLVGVLPFPVDELRTAGVDAMRRVICEQEPPRPSERLARLGARADSQAAARRMTVEGLRRVLRNDLDWVIAKALEKDRERRYGSVGALADDLQRFLDHEPLQAGPPSKIYRLRKVARRYRAQILVAAMVLVTAVLGGGFATWNAMEANLAEARAVAAVHDFDLLASVSRTRDARQRAEELSVTWPDRTQALERWFTTDAAAALLMRADVEDAIARLTAVAGGSDAPNRAESKAFLREALEGTRDIMRQLAGETTATMSRRLYWARQQWLLGLRHPNAPHSWADVRAALATNPRYADSHIELTDADIVGLVPIGENPVTHYWEFYDLRSAWDGNTDPAKIEIPSHRADGSILVTGSTGIVFVLLPGGPYLSGPAGEEGAPATGADPTDTLPSHEVTLEPFFCARHEITRLQWWRLSGTAPFNFPFAIRQHDDREVLDDVPAESISWLMGAGTLATIGCSLPTEAQWEYACRGGTRTAWWPGSRPEDLQDRANIADRTRLVSHPLEGLGAPIVDRFSLLAPVGSFRANAFGLFDMHGNVIEWCGNDYHVPTLAQVTALDGDPVETPSQVPMRGGWCAGNAAEARCAKRDSAKADFSMPMIGLRAVRLARHPWRERLRGFDAASLATMQPAVAAWSPSNAPRIRAGRWKALYGASETDIREDQITISETGVFNISDGERKGASGTWRHDGGVAIFESERFCERWSPADGKWRIESWHSKRDMESGLPVEDVGIAEWQFSLPYIGPGK